MTLAEERAARSAAHDLPALADGVELIGDYEGSGFKEPPSLVRRGDGQVLQLPPLLYSVAVHADGGNTYEQIAAAVSDEIKRGLDGDQVRFLADEKLRPLGVLAAADGSSPPVRKLDPFLGLKLRIGVIPERASNLLGAIFQPLFFPPVVVAVLVGLVVADAWLFFEHGVAQSVRESMMTPAVFLGVFGAVVLAAGFHEIGHAAACRYGGGRPGKMGCGLYLAWPAFYTDVTDAYRLGKRARLRTDLGGVYFNAIVVLVSIGAYVVTGFEPVLLLAVIMHFEIAHQLLPIVRLDGYYIIADLTGVPDLFARIGPILRSMLPWKHTEDEVRVLKPWVRIAVTAWVVVVVPLLLLQLLMLLIHLPRILATAWESASELWATTRAGFDGGDWLTGVGGIVQLVVLAIPIVGISIVLAKISSGTVRSIGRRTEGRPVLRTLAIGSAVGGAAALAMSWIPSDNYEPIQPHERGTITEGVRAVTRLPRGDAPLVSNETEPSTTSTTVPPTTSTTTADSTSTTTTDSTTTTLADETTSTTDEDTTTTSSSTTSSTTTP